MKGWRYELLGSTCRSLPYQFTCEGDNSQPASPPDRLLSILHPPLSRGEIKTLFIQFIRQPELITVPGRVQNYLTSKPSKPASCNAKPGTECPCIHQEPHTAQPPPLPWSAQKWTFLSEWEAPNIATCVIKHILDTSLSPWSYRMNFKRSYIST